MYTKLTFISLIATFGLLACNQDVKKRCCDTGSQSFISDSVKVYVPDAFTPNGDGINDIFTYYINKPEAFVMHRLIVSKGNVLAFDKQDTAKIVWDGLIDGKKAKENVLNYKLTLKRANATTADSLVELKGTICLRREVPICATEVANCKFPDQFDAQTGAVNPTSENLDTNCK